MSHRQRNKDSFRSYISRRSRDRCFLIAIVNALISLAPILRCHWCKWAIVDSKGVCIHCRTGWMTCNGMAPVWCQYRPLEVAGISRCLAVLTRMPQCSHIVTGSSVAAHQPPVSVGHFLPSLLAHTFVASHRPSAHCPVAWECYGTAWWIACVPE